MKSQNITSKIAYTNYYSIKKTYAKHAITGSEFAPPFIQGVFGTNTYIISACCMHRVILYITISLFCYI